MNDTNEPENSQVGEAAVPGGAPEARSYPAPEARSYPAPETWRYPTPEARSYPAPEARSYPAPETWGYPAPKARSYPAPEARSYPAPEARSYPAPEATPAKFNTKPARKVFSRMGWALSAMMAVTYLIPIVIGVIFYFDKKPEWFNAASELIVRFSFCVLGVPLFYLIVRKMPRDDRLRHRRFSAGGFVAALVVSTTAMAVGILISLVLKGVLNQSLVAQISNPLETLLTNGSPWITAIGVCVLAPVFEELVFRKIFIDRISRYGDATALVLSGVLFGLCHGNFGQFFHAMFVGMIFAWVYLRSGKIILTIIMHAFINFSGAVALPYLLSLARAVDLDGVSSEVAGKNATGLFLNMLPLLLYLLILLNLAIAGLVILIAKRKKLSFAPAVDVLPKGKRFSVTILNAGMIVYVVFMLVLFAADIF